MEKRAIQFGTDGWREVIAKQFTFDNVEIVTRAIAEYILERFGTERPVIIGYDLRFQADKFGRHAAEVLAEYGLNVMYSDTWHPTPVIAYMALHKNSAGAMMFTASHNPSEYLGIKFIPEYAGPAMPEITDKIVANVRRFEADTSLVVPPQNVEKPGEISTLYPKEEYITFLKTLIDFDMLKKASHLKILYDPMFGAGQGYTDVLLQSCGIHVDTQHTGHDPLFGGMTPEPKEDYLPELIRRVKTEGYDLGLASDGDSDRFGVVDSTGHFLTANEIVPMIFRHLYKDRGFRGAVVRSIATSKLLDRLAEVYGDVEVIETPVGFKWIGDCMRKQAVIIGGEESGGFSILGNIPEKDGVLANLLIVEMLAAQGKPIQEIYQDTLKEAGMKFYNYFKNYHLTQQDKDRIVNTLLALKAGDHFGPLAVESVDHRDGVKLYFGKYEWITVRPSGTEPLLRTYMEATDPDVLAQIKTSIEQILSPQPAGCC